MPTDRDDKATVSRPVSVRARYTRAYLDSFATLEKGWDSYGGQPIEAAACAAAWRFVEAIRNGRFQFTPCPNGGVQIDTYDGDELSWGPDGTQEFD